MKTGSTQSLPSLNFDSIAKPGQLKDSEHTEKSCIFCMEPSLRMLEMPRMTNKGLADAEWRKANELRGRKFGP